MPKLKLNISFISLFLGSLLLVSLTFTNCGEFESRSAESFITQQSLTSELDKKLKEIIITNNLNPLPEIESETDAMVTLGRSLFNEVNMSGHKNVSCATCHQDKLGSGDGLPLAIGSSGVGEFPDRKQDSDIGRAMNRHAPSIFNKGHKNMLHGLWDGRLQFFKGVIYTPVPEISGPNPQRKDIADMMENVGDIQPLFPIVTPLEFLGENNELADIGEGDPVGVWDYVLQSRLLSQENYKLFFKNAFPNTNIENFNPGHIGRAIRAFVKVKFLANNTPFDQYLAGDLSALNEPEKKGMITFYTKGQCNSCHSGNYFSNNGFFSVAVPQLGFAPFDDDFGREDATGNISDRYKFKTPGLRNIKLSGPYMHNGAFENLRDVIEHKSNVKLSNENYKIPSSYKKFYDDLLIVDQNPERTNERINQISLPALKNGLNLSEEEKENLFQFLSNGLLDPSFIDR